MSHDVITRGDENYCMLRTEEAFIKRCEESEIDSSWYSLDGGNAPIRLKGNRVYYENEALMCCFVQMSVYDIMYEALLDFKERHEWERSDELYRISAIYINSKYWMEKTFLDYPFVSVTKNGYSKAPEQAFLDEGWQPVCYDPALAYYKYRKVMDVRDNIRDVTFCFHKKTDRRDRDAFGFAEDILYGEFCCPVPDGLLESIAAELWDKKNNLSRCAGRPYLSLKLRTELARHCTENLMEHEFEALLRLKHMHEEAVQGAIDLCLSQREQLDAFDRASRAVVGSCPAYSIVHGSRSYIITRQSFKKACDMAGITKNVVSVSS